MVWTAKFQEGADPREKCPVNLTNHTYWNLSGEFQEAKVNNHGLILNANRVLETDDAQAPTGKLLPVQDTLLDFRPQITQDEEGNEIWSRPRLVGEGKRLEGAIKVLDKVGLDHAFVIDRTTKNDKELCYTATLQHEESGRKMKVSTTQPSVVVFTANQLQAADD